MKTNYEIRYAAHPEDAKGYDTQRIRRDFLMEKVFSDNEVNMVYSMYDRMIVHGFRPNRSCHTALNEIQKTFTGVKWFIEGDIKGFFDNINHATLIGILRVRINDERFLRLVRKFLNAGYIENWTFHNTYSGTPQGGIISPILANIYLDKFDKYVNEYVRKFKKGKKRMRTKEYRRNEVVDTRSFAQVVIFL